MLWTYALKSLVEKLIEIKVDNDGITTMGNVPGKKTYIYVYNHHAWGCTVYVLDAIFQDKYLEYPSGNPDHV